MYCFHAFSSHSAKKTWESKKEKKLFCALTVTAKVRSAITTMSLQANLVGSLSGQIHTKQRENGHPGEYPHNITVVFLS